VIAQSCFSIMLALQFGLAQVVVGGRGPAPAWLSIDTQATNDSPDGKWRVAVIASKAPSWTWLVLEPTNQPEYQYQKWPLQRNGCYVLWRPDSKTFAVTDPAYADHYFVRVFSTDFRVEGKALGSPAIDLSVPIEAAFERLATRYYGFHKYEINTFCPKAMRWLSTGDLLVGLDARTSESTSLSGPTPGIRNWYRAYLIDPAERRVTREMESSTVAREFGIDLQKERW
jgi:hypothetical protein